MEKKIKKKILLVITKSNFGGAQRYVFDIATRLPKSQYEVSVALGGDGALKNMLESAEIPVITIPHLARNVNPLADCKAFLALYRIFKKVAPDIVHLNSSKMTAMGAVAGWLIFKKRPKIVHTVHGWAFKEERFFLSRFLIYLISWLSVILSDKTIVVSQADRSYVSSTPFTHKKISVIHNGIASLAFRDAVAARRELLPAHWLEKDNVTVVGTISELHNNKGLTYTIEAVASLQKRYPSKNLLFVVMGEGEERDHLTSLVNDLEVNNNILLIGHKKDAPLFLKAFDIFTLTSIKEGLPYCLLEAGLARLPVVTTHVGGIPEIIHDMKTGILVRPKDTHEIEKALEFLIMNPKKAESFGTENHKAVHKEFTRARMMREIEAIYSEISNS